VVAFGDSITDGTCSTLDAHDRWEDLVSVRLNLAHEMAASADGATRDRLLSIINEGIGGNTLTRDGLDPPPDSPTGLERLERDVLSHHGVRSVVLFMGTNDIRRGASTSQVIEAMTTIAQKVKASGARVVGVTIIPRHNTPVGAATPWDAAKTRIRNEVNDWVRTRAPFDGVIDFSRVVQDPANPDLILAAFNCGDGIHPSPRGYFEMGRAVDLSLLHTR
jgi:lysophospholipase L1-like esterase